MKRDYSMDSLNTMTYVVYHGYTSNILILAIFANQLKNLHISKFYTVITNSNIVVPSWKFHQEKFNGQFWIGHDYETY